MILPTKHLREDQALIAIGADLLALLSEPKTVSRLWDELRRARAKEAEAAVPRSDQRNRPQQAVQPACSVPFDWFILALDLLFLLGAIELQRGRIRRIAA
jgi:hypothetical protein